MVSIREPQNIHVQFDLLIGLVDSRVSCEPVSHEIVIYISRVAADVH